ncbi:MAG: DUF805 domain-containing protein [Bacteroidota bacterium]
MIDEAAGWTLQAFGRFADFDGRSHRRELLSFYGVNAVVVGLLVGASSVLGATLDLSFIAAGAVASVYLAVAFVPALSLVARRLHDVGRSSLWVLLGAVPVVGLVLVVWLLAPGEPGPNRWGRSPATRPRGDYDRV